MEYSERQLGLLRGRISPSTPDEMKWVDEHANDVISEEPRNSTGEPPSIDTLPPVDRLTGKRVELLAGRPKKSMYPGTNPPGPMPPLGGVPRGDRD